MIDVTATRIVTPSLWLYDGYRIVLSKFLVKHNKQTIYRSATEASSLSADNGNLMVSTRYLNAFRHIPEPEYLTGKLSSRQTHAAMQCGSTAVGVTRAERGPVPPSGSGQCRSRGESRVYLHTQIFVISTRHRGRGTMSQCWGMTT